MLVAVLEGSRGSVKRNVEFSSGIFTAEGLGEMSVEDLRELDAAGQVRWLSHDLRVLAMGYSHEAGALAVGTACIADEQLELAVETEVVYVPPHRLGSRTEAELKRIVSDMTERGWILVEDSRIGASGGHLTFQRAEPLAPELLAALGYVG